MSNQKSEGGPANAPRPQVIVMEASRDTRSDVAEPLGPRVIATEQTGRVVQVAPPKPPAPVPVQAKRSSLVMIFARAGLLAALGAWLGIDLYLWIASAFTYSTGLGWAAAAATVTGVAAAGAIVAREMRSYLALKDVEANQRRLAMAPENARPSDVQDAIRDVVAAIPKDSESIAAIEAFQRKVQRHHSPAQRIELLSQTVMSPLDRRAEAIVRGASSRAFAITAVSPTAVTDALFFIATSVRMVREIAACYGHRPAAFATCHLLRRLVVEAGRLGAVDLAGTTLTQQLGGAVVERVATSAAESMYAAQRTARLGIVTMDLCRPVPFQPNEAPGIMSSLIGNLFAKFAEPLRGK